MNGSTYKSKRRDSGVIPFADESPFPTAKLNSISEMSLGSSSSAESLPSRGRPRRSNKGGNSKSGSSTSASALSDQSNSEPVRKPGISGRRNVQLSNLQTNIAIEEDSSSSASPPQSPRSTGNPRRELSPMGKHEPTAGSSLRRNSISLPFLNNVDLEALQQAHMDSKMNRVVDSQSSIYSSNTPENSRPESPLRTHHFQKSSDDESSNEEEKPMYRSALRTKRRLSVAPLPSLRLNDKEMLANEFDRQSIISNQNSLTSVNSLASLLKEKMQSFPSMIRKKRKATNDFKIKAFVAMLFLIIVLLIGYAYVMYTQQVLARLHFNRIQFNKDTRAFRLFDNRKELLAGQLGTNIHSGKPFICLNEWAVYDGSVCLEWDRQARMYLKEDKETKDCFNIKWQSLTENNYPTDCFDFAKENEYWYGGGITKKNDWPISKATFDFVPFITGDAKVQEFGNALGRYFVSSGGVAIEVDERTPLYISMNRNHSGQFCMRAKNDAFAFVNRLTPLPELSYKVCFAADMKDLHKSMRQQSLWDGLKETDINIVHSLLQEPIWQIPAASIDDLTESTIYNFTEDVIAMGYMRLGHVLINEFWQKEIGDFTLDTERFQTLVDTVNILHRRGFKVVFTVQPFISTDSASFSEAVQKKLLIYERLSERSIPALTRYKSAPSTGVLDITNNASIAWLVEKLNKVVKDYQIDSFFLDFGTAHNMPHYYQCSRSLVNPDQYKTIFGNAFEDSIKIMAFSGAVSVPTLPAFLSLPPVNSSWEGLQTIITTALSYGVIGYPFILPGPVGGDYFVQKNDSRVLSYHSLEQPPLPDQELYIRWLQLATFLPSIRFSHLPDEYKSDYVTEIAKELASIRQKTVIPILKKYLSDAMNEAVPLVRPLWMLDSQDPACLSADDEFSVGEELIVAPILHKGETKREVYLPYGVWKDGVDGSLRKGHRWIHNYRVPEDKVAYFVKMPDNTRF